MRQAEETLARHRGRGEQERLTWASLHGWHKTLLPRVAVSFRAELPHVKLEMFGSLSAISYPRLREGSLDLMIGRIGPEEALQALPLFRYEMTVLARRGHSHAGPQSIADLLDGRVGTEFHARRERDGD